MDRDYQAEMQAAIQVAIQAGRLVMEVYGENFKVDYKADKSPVTQADRRADDYIRQQLKEAFPQHGLLSEESKDQAGLIDKELCFIIDPVDGTKEFVRRSGDFGVNVALSDQGRSVMGVIFIPSSREIYYACRGLGSFRGRVDDKDQVQDLKKNQVSGRTSDLIMTMSKPFPGPKTAALLKEVKDRIASILYVGSSIKGCMVAAGQADVYYRFGLTSEWDTAAMQAIVEEAGGLMAQMDGSPLRYNRKNHVNEKGFYVVNSRANVWRGGKG